MMSRTQITLEPEIQRLARRRASDMGISLAEYVRSLVTRDLGATPAKVDPSALFDLGSSGGSDIARTSRRCSATHSRPPGAVQKARFAIVSNEYLRRYFGLVRCGRF